jgi:hypothetical protein
MKFCRIDLSKTNYNQITDVSTSIMGFAQRDDNLDGLQAIYQQYCAYKNFSSVMPLFPSLIFDKYTDVHGYYYNSKLVAFSLVKRHDQVNAESLQFAWDYLSPELKLGIRSLEHECAYYKNLGFSYLYLGQVSDYKSKFDGYEILGKLQ